MIPPMCPCCGEDRLIEILGRVLFCAVCAHESRLETAPSARDVGPGRAIDAEAKAQVHGEVADVEKEF